MGFQVGDRVLSHAPNTVYLITYEGWEGYVTQVGNPILSGHTKDDICVNEDPNADDGFPVESKYFENLSVIERENIAVSYDELLEIAFGSESN